MREMTVSLTNGGVVGLIMAGSTWVFFHDVRLAVTIGLALVINMFVGALAGVLAPLTLERLGRDPAVSSSVFVTFVTDLMGFLSFLGLASLILL
jgi:magnesium transporter